MQRFDMWTDMDKCVFLGYDCCRAKRPEATMTKRLTVLLTDEEFAEFDAFCRQGGFKKSTLIVRLIRELLTGQTGAGRVASGEGRRIREQGPSNESAGTE